MSNKYIMKNVPSNDHYFLNRNTVYESLKVPKSLVIGNRNMKGRSGNSQTNKDKQIIVDITLHRRQQIEPSKTVLTQV